MSSDLWAAFGDGEAASNPWSSDSPNQSTKPTANTQDSTSRQPQAENVDTWANFETAKPQATPLEDEWSAFESADPASTNVLTDDWSAFEAPTTAPEKANITSTTTPDPWAAFENSSSHVAPIISPEKPISGSRTNDTTFNDDGLMWDADSALQNETIQPTPSQSASGNLIDISGLTVLDQPEEDDEFGDFAEAETPPVPQVKPRTPAKQRDASTAIFQNRVDTQGAKAANKLIFGATKKDTLSRQDPAATGSGVRNVGSAKRPTAAAQTRAKPTTLPLPPIATDNDDVDEAWDDFDSLPAEPPQPATPNVSTKSVIQAVPPTTALPPTNVPPPSILLSLIHTTILPSLITPQSGSPNSALRTTARILAGRKQRWKRDTHLAQSMSISAISTGPGVKSGMKLAGIDKSEAVREDREAAEVTRVFKAEAGALRARALKAGEKGIVDVGGNLVVRVEKGDGKESGSGVLGGMKPCVICGLRRAERIGGVDAEVFDGFGEWWVDHWGHRECKEWWIGNERKLGKR